jgi:hypothetical protein
MSKQTLKPFSLVELQTTQFDDKSIHDVFNNNMFKLSCIYGMFKFVKSRLSFEKIMEIIKNDNWMERKFWSWEEHDTFIIELAKVYKNIYQYNNTKSLRCAQDFVFLYGFAVKDTKENADKHLDNLLKLSL